MAVTTAVPTTETTLFMKRSFKASREEVFKAWTTPDRLIQWFAATKDHVGFIGEVDLRVDGRFRMGMKHLSSGKEHIATGVYREVRFPERLVFTWSWEGAPEHGESRITIDLREIEGGAEMYFTQEFFPSRKVRDDHEGGWNGCFEKLQKLIEG